MVDHLSPELIVSSLRLLVEGYKLARERFKNRKTPEEIEKIVIKAEKSEPKTLSRAEIDRALKEVLNPEDAAVVSGDLDLLGLLILPPPNLDAFDYWGILARLVTGLQNFARDNRLFELRGSNRAAFGQILLLPKTSHHILPARYAEKFAKPYDMQTLKDANGLAFFAKEGQGFPIYMMVRARFNQYSMGGGQPVVESDLCNYQIGPGQQKHWLKFYKLQGAAYHFVDAYKYMLEAADFAAIAKGLRDDIHDYARAISADEQKIVPLMTAIDIFLKGGKSG